MKDFAPIRTAAAAAPGDMIAVSKTQLAQLLDEVEAGQQARRELMMLSAAERAVSERQRPIWCGYDAGTDLSPAPDQAQ